MDEPEQDSPAARLTPQQRLFVEEYLTCWNGAEAARRAGYSARTARQQASDLLSSPNIEALIGERIKQAAMGADEVLARLADQARGSLADFVDVTAGGGWRIDLGKAKRLGKMHLLAELGYTKHGPKVKLHDAQAALVHLGKHHRLFAEVQEHSGPGGGPIEARIVEAARKAYGDDDGPA